MYQEKRHLVLNGEVVTELNPYQKVLIDGRGAAILDWKQSKICFYNQKGEQKEVKLPKKRAWVKAEAFFGVVRITDDNVWIAYLMDGECLGEFSWIADIHVTNGNETWGMNTEGEKVLLRAIRW